VIAAPCRRATPFTLISGNALAHDLSGLRR